jgi:hypothetical protein
MHVFETGRSSQSQVFHVSASSRLAGLRTPNHASPAGRRSRDARVASVPDRRASEDRARPASFVLPPFEFLTHGLIENLACN